MLTVADQAQHGFFDASWCGDLLPGDSTYSLLAEHGHRIISDEDFADCYAERAGRPSIPPSLLAKMLLLAYRDGLSDERAMEALRFDLRWKVALDLPIDHPGFHSTSLVRFRARLLLHGRERLVFERSLCLAKDEATEQIVDSTPMLGAAAAQDTISLVRSGVRHLHRKTSSGGPVMRTSPAATASDRGRSFISLRDRRSPERAAGWTVAAILTVACGIHVYWALGGTWGAATAYGSTDLPPRAMVAVVAALIAGAGAVVLVRIGAWGIRLPARLLRLGPWALVAVFALAGVGNLMAPEGSYARDWHVFFFGPLLLIVALLCAVVARSPIPGAPRR